MNRSWKLKYVAPLATAALMVGGGAAGFAQMQNQPSQAQNQKSPQQNSQMQKGGRSQNSAQNQPGDKSADQNQSTAQNQPADQNGSQNQTSAMNMDRSQIEQVQKALDRKGFRAGRADGRMGRETEAALKSFQQKEGLPANGQIDRQTMAQLGLKNMSNMSRPSTSGQGSGAKAQQPPPANNQPNNSQPKQNAQ